MYLKDGHWLGETFQVERALRIEAKALPNTELAHCRRNGDTTGRSHCAKSCRQLNCGPEQVAAFCNRLPDADANADVNGPLSAFVSLAQRALNVDGGLNGSRHGRERRHDPISRMLHLASCLCVQCGAHDLVVIANEHHEPVVAQFLRLLRRVTKVGEQNYPNSRLDIRLPCRVSGNLTKKRIYGPITHLDDVVGDQTVRLPMNSFQGLSVGPLGETKHSPFRVIEPVGDVADFVFVLNGEIECVRGGDVGSGCARRLVSIKEQGHTE